MKKKIIKVIYIILILIMLKLIYNFSANSILLSKYNDGIYDENLSRILTFFNFPQSYVADYNYGNILYKNGKYESAIEEYKKALKGFVPKYKKCNIIINYALAICKTVNVNEENQDSINNAISIYESAIDILTQEGCANKNDNNGHSEQAEKLKSDIQKEIERLKKLQNIENSEENEENKDEEESNSEESESIEEKIQNIKENATEDQREIEKLYNNFDKEINTNKKNW